MAETENADLFGADGSHIAGAGRAPADIYCSASWPRKLGFLAWPRAILLAFPLLWSLLSLAGTSCLEMTNHVYLSHKCPGSHTEKVFEEQDCGVDRAAAQLFNMTE